MNDTGRVSGPDLAGGRRPIGTLASSPRTTRLTIRAWTPDRVELGWTSESALIYLISDLISASGGTLVDDAVSGIVAHFNDPAQAFRTAKRMQWSLLEFCQQRPDLCLGAAVVIYDPTELPVDAQGNSSQEITALLENLKPAQILASAGVGKVLQDLPGLQLRAFPPSQRASSSWQRGVQELVWTTPANFEQIQQTLKNLAQTKPRKDDLVLANEPTVDFGAMAHGAAQPTRVHVSPIQVERANLLSELGDLEPAGGSGSRALWWSLAGAGAVAVILSLIFLPHLFSKKIVVLEHPAAVQSTPSAETSTVNTEPPPTPQPPTEQVPPPSPKPVEKHKTPPHAVPSEPPSHPSDKKTTEYKISEYEGMTEKDIPLLLRKAENDAGAGNYDDARREFNIVLHLDPGNKEAKEGLHKLDLTERESR